MDINNCQVSCLEENTQYLSVPEGCDADVTGVGLIEGLDGGTELLLHEEITLLNTELIFRREATSSDYFVRQSFRPSVRPFDIILNAYCSSEQLV